MVDPLQQLPSSTTNTKNYPSFRSKHVNLIRTFVILMVSLLAGSFGVIAGYFLGIDHETSVVSTTAPVLSSTKNTPSVTVITSPTSSITASPSTSPTAAPTYGLKHI